MMPTMIARATQAALDELIQQAHHTKQNAYVGDDDVNDLLLDGYFDLTTVVRHVIEAMREPTEEMLQEYGFPYTREMVTANWKAMIDAALKEGQAGS